MKRIIVFLIVALVSFSAKAQQARYEGVPLADMTIPVASATTNASSATATNIIPATGRIVALSVWSSIANTVTVSTVAGTGFGATSRTVGDVVAVAASNGVVVNINSNFYINGELFKTTGKNSYTGATHNVKTKILVEK